MARVVGERMALWDGSDVVAIPAELPLGDGGQKRHRSGAAKRRTANDLPREFFVGIADGKKVIVHALARAESLSCLAGVLAAGMDAERLSVLAEACAGACLMTAAPESVLCWELASDMTWLTPPSLLPEDAMQSKVRQACNLAPRHDVVQALHRRVCRGLGLQLIVVAASVLALLQSGRTTMVPTPTSFARFARLLPPAMRNGGAEAAELPGTLEEFFAQRGHPRIEDIEMEVGRNTTAKRGGPVDHEYPVHVIVQSLQLMWALRNIDQTPLCKVVRMSWELSLPKPQVEELKNTQAQGQIPLPKRTMLRSAGVKLDMMYSLFQRTLLSAKSAFRFLSIDASPIAHTNFLAIREDAIMWPKGLSVDDFFGLDLPSHSSSRHLPLGTLGHGAASEVHKGVNLAHALIIESGSWHQMCTLRDQVLGFTSDQGVEAGLADAPWGISSAADMAQWKAVVAKVALEQATSMPDTVESFLLPRCLPVPDHLHMVFGALENGVKKSEGWANLETDLNHISTFLRNSGLRKRFVAVCLSCPGHRALFRRHVGSLTDWKWEHVHAFLQALQPCLPVLIEKFDIRALEGGDGVTKSSREITAAILKNVATALKHKNLAEKVAVLKVVSYHCDRIATWCEGCSCHEDLLHSGNGPWQQRVKRYREKSKNCPWKGKRACDLACGSLARLLSSLADASDQQLKVAYAAAGPGVRSDMAFLETSLKSFIGQQISQKLSFWQHLPHSLVAIFGRERGLCSLEESKASAVRALKEYDTAVANGRARKLHRVAHIFLATDSCLRPMIMGFAQGSSAVDLKAFPVLWQQLFGYSQVPVVCRRIEAVHACVKRLKSRANNHEMAWLAAALRRPDVEAELDRGDDFMNFLRRTWRKRLFIRLSLQAIFSRSDLLAMSHKTFLGWWYCSSVKSQYRDVKGIGKATQRWTSIIKGAKKPPEEHTNDVLMQLVRYLKTKFSSPGVFWSALAIALPSLIDRSSLLRLADAVAEDAPLVAGDLQGDGFRNEPLAVIDDNFESEFRDAAELAKFMCNNIRRADLEEAPPLVDHVIFRVSNAWPEMKKILRPSHLSVSKAIANLIVFRGAFSGSSVDFDPLMCIAAEIDLRPFLKREVLTSIRQWNVVTHDVRTCSLPPLVYSELDALDALAAELPRFEPREVDRPARLARASRSAACTEVVEKLADARAFAEVDMWVPSWDFMQAGFEGLEVLAKHGCVRIREDDFDDTEVCLVGANLNIAFSCRVSEPITIFNVPIASQLQQASKLDLMFLLTREGWTGQDFPPRLVGLDGPFVFGFDMFARAKEYFVCLAQHQQIFAKGCVRIDHRRPQHYYSCLLKLPDLRSFHDMLGIDMMGNEQFRKVLQGLPVGDGPPALVDGLALADDDADDEEDDNAGNDDNAMAALEDGEPPPQPLAVAAEIVLGPALAGTDAFVRANLPVPVGQGLLVRFDFMSHSSRIQRGYIRCLHHQSCFRYRQVNQFPTRAALLAYLQAWAEAGGEVSRATHVDPHFAPPQGRVQELEAALR